MPKQLHFVILITGVLTVCALFGFLLLELNVSDGFFSAEASDKTCQFSLSKTKINLGETVEAKIEAYNSEGIYEVRYHDGRTWGEGKACHDLQQCTAIWNLSPDQPGTYEYSGGFYTPRGTWSWGWQSEWISCPEKITLTVDDRSHVAESDRHLLSVSVSGQGMVTSSPGQIACGGGLGVCSDYFDYGTRVTLEAEAVYGETGAVSFSHWSGACSGEEETCSLIMNKDQTVSAVFGQESEEDYSHCTISASKKEVKTGETFNIEVSAGDSRGITSVHMGEYDFSAEKYNWTRSSNCQQEQTCTTIWPLQASQPGTYYYAGFYKPFQADGSGELISCGKAVKVIVTGEEVTENICSVSASKERVGVGESFEINIQAHHVDGVRVIYFVENEEDAISVQECSEGDQECEKSFRLARNNPGTYEYSGIFISNSGDYVLCSNVATVVVEGELSMSSLSVSLEGQGMVVSDPGGINCGSGFYNCSADFSHEEEVTLTASVVSSDFPSDQFIFSHWRGACSGDAPVCTLDMRESRSVTAVFIQDSQCVISVSPATIEIGEKAQIGLSAGDGRGIDRLYLGLYDSLLKEYTWYSRFSCGGQTKCSYSWDRSHDQTGQYLYVGFYMSEIMPGVYPPGEREWVRCEGSDKLEVVSGLEAEGDCSFSATKTEVAVGESFDLRMQAQHPEGVTSGYYLENGERGSVKNCAAKECDFQWSLSHQVPGSYDYVGRYVIAGSGTTLTCQEKVTVAVKGEISEHNLSVDISGQGYVSSDCGNINCGGVADSCSANFEHGETVVLNAQPIKLEDSNEFSHWSGGCQGDDPVCTVKMDRDRLVEAVFAEPELITPECSINIGKTAVEQGEELGIMLKAQDYRGISTIHLGSYDRGEDRYVWSDARGCERLTSCQEIFFNSHDKPGVYQYAGFYVPVTKPGEGEYVLCDNTTNVRVSAKEKEAECTVDSDCPPDQCVSCEPGGKCLLYTYSCLEGECVKAEKWVSPWHEACI